MWISQALSGWVTSAKWRSKSEADPCSGAWDLLAWCYRACQLAKEMVPPKSCLALPKAILRWELLDECVNAGITAAKQAPNEWRREKMKHFRTGQLVVPLHSGAAGCLGGSKVSWWQRAILVLPGKRGWASFQKEVFLLHSCTIFCSYLCGFWEWWFLELLLRAVHGRDYIYNSWFSNLFVKAQLISCRCLCSTCFF